MTESRYAAVARQRIERIMRKVGTDDRKKLRRALRDGYPFAQRSGWAYRVWLREVKAMANVRNMGKPKNEKQLDMFGGKDEVEA